MLFLIPLLLLSVVFVDVDLVYAFVTVLIVVVVVVVFVVVVVVVIVAVVFVVFVVSIYVFNLSRDQEKLWLDIITNFYNPVLNRMKPQLIGREFLLKVL